MINIKQIVLNLYPHEVSAMLNALSRDILHLSEGGAERYPELLSAVDTYQLVHKVYDKQYPESLYTNPAVKRIIEANQ